MSNLLRSVLDLSECPKNPVITIYDKDDIKVCSTSNELEFDYICLQIAKNKIEGCYLIYNNDKYPIESTGRINNWPSGLFDMNVHLLLEICRYDLSEPPLPLGSNIIDELKCPKNEYVDIYDNEDRRITRTNEDVTFNWVRAEIKEKQLKGCYLIFHGQRINIDHAGNLYDYPDGLFDENTNQLCRLIK